MRVTTKILATAATVGVLLGLNYLFEYGFGDFRINAYYARILNLIGINVILAVSLNLINGLAGQFSIGHAGFMAVGGYSATFVTVYDGRAIAGLLGSSLDLSLIHISEPTRQAEISYAVFCLKKKKKK